jgi:hypothetical protein
MTSPLDLDLSQDPVGRASSFALGCTATWVFVRNLVMRPAVKSCHQQIAELRQTIEWLKGQLASKDESIMQLQAVLISSGGRLANAMQAALSEEHQETVAQIKALAAKLEVRK